MYADNDSNAATQKDSYILLAMFAGLIFIASFKRKRSELNSLRSRINTLLDFKFKRKIISETSFGNYSD